MKQSRTSAPAFDLDDLERELKKASAPRQAAPSDDPLAELARIVGQEPAATPGKAGSVRDPFEEFLAQTSAAEPGPVKTPAIAPLFPEGLRQVDDTPLDSPIMLEPAQAPAAISAVDPLEALLAQDIGLRSGLDDLPAPRVTMPVQQADMPREVDWTAAEVQSAAEAPGAEPAVKAAAEAAAVTEPPAPGVAQGNRPPFDDMLAEFEAAMRDAAGDSVRGSAPSVEPMIAPPPGDIIVPPPVRMDPPPIQHDSVGIGTVGAAAVAAGAGAAVVATKARPKRGIMLAGGAIAVAVIGLGSLALFGGGKAGRTPSGPVPVIEAKSGSSKERPANPGGVDVPNQDKEILQTRAPEPSRQERLAPREEQPVDLTQAQRQASAAPPSAVRQIPGVAIVAPGGTPPAAAVPAPAAAAPVPAAEPPARPVASVPIVISGQPPAIPAAPPAAPTPAPAPAPVAAAPSPAPVAAPAASQTPAASPPRAPVAAPSTPQQQAAAAQPPSEPRRVRSVPIRPESGEAAPQRAQPQPRVVSAPAATDQNAPLSITPQANRVPAAAPAPQRQVAVQQGSVPSSVPSLSDPAPAASDPAPQRTASTGSGFSVQLAAEGSEDAARAKFNRLKGQHGSVLGGASPSIRSAEVNGRSVYRVRVGNMSRDEAARMCERLKASGGSCFVARN
jgi:cell division septation protein DedD